MNMMTKLVITGALGLFLVGCSGDDAVENDKASSPAVEAPKEADKPAEKASEPTSFLDVTVNDPGHANRTEYVDPSYAQIFYGYNKAKEYMLPIKEWPQYGNPSSLGFEDDFFEMQDLAARFNSNSAGAFEKRDAETAWEQNWESAVLNKNAPSRLMREIGISSVTSSENFYPYDFDTQAFRINLENGTNQGEKIEAWVSWPVNPDYGFTFVNLPGEISVPDEADARKIEEMRQNNDLSVRIYGGVIGTKDVRRSSRTTYRLLVADFHFGELVSRNTGKVVLTF